jgi:hypothetical protein
LLGNQGRNNEAVRPHTSTGIKRLDCFITSVHLIIMDHYLKNIGICFKAYISCSYLNDAAQSQKYILKNSFFIDHPPPTTAHAGLRVILPRKK